jgi:hypothetical protein
MKLEIFTGTGARHWLADAAFLEQWRALAAGDRKFTLLQEPAFVRAWFAV